MSSGLAASMLPETSERPFTHSQLRLVQDKPLRILLVEDDASDVMLTETVLQSLPMEYELYTLTSGREVLLLLSRQGAYYDDPKMDLLLLDLSLPGMNGFEVLSELAQKKRHEELPIAILTGDSHCGFLKHTSELNIVAYLTKPCTPQVMGQVIASIGSGKH